jgi:aerobic-type carbon monoxide dehydrogenase small subunit (CoxS/CutS family)
MTEFESVFKTHQQPTQVYNVQISWTKTSMLRKGYCANDGIMNAKSNVTNMDADIRWNANTATFEDKERLFAHQFCYQNGNEAFVKFKDQMLEALGIPVIDHTQ